MKTKTIKVEYKSTQLISILSKNLAGKMNLVEGKIEHSVYNKRRRKLFGYSYKSNKFI
jgi:hypothetical protein